MRVYNPSKCVSGTLHITGSKSETNRLLILKHLSKNNIEIKNLSNSKDSEMMSKALSTEESLINIGMAGTAMRFLTSFFAIKQGSDIVLTGDSRMKERPIKVLVDALRDIGANIEYTEIEGYPPIRIMGKRLEGGQIDIAANISSQYITSILLIAPFLKRGLKINMKERVASMPYIQMTISLLQELGVKVKIDKNCIQVPFFNPEAKTLSIESDWSSASYIYSVVAMSKKANVKLLSYKKNSRQGDSILPDIYKKLGVQTKFGEDYILLKKDEHFSIPEYLEFDMIETPDLAQTVVVTCVGLKIKCKITGLHTLKIKETDRLVALKNELEKIGAKSQITNSSIEILSVSNKKIEERISVYNDHRMAMSFAALGVLCPIEICDYNVVNKSYPSFWKDFENINFVVDFKE
ncbi:3-phosphoshikimate 1-carboxyvinyltransferase [Ichthyobacterium seriolicida]|uniref:3-phosphoshikimate 1-carboxyvinyltransferase n=1 Tax=Ichthyobacterium seriolicida TaxID=242600 RepID=A0A1J1EAP6_9FLAO|nr:3-phosphoshikimate 1-carboxyvinyltransferase [Ichthyobacterium seriolicida]BAV95011.1 3-phosphoshikimate 1-carboxyvinyltransferase [Ichthyobacterium seriolicida]